MLKTLILLASVTLPNEYVNDIATAIADRQCRLELISAIAEEYPSATIADAGAIYQRPEIKAKVAECVDIVKLRVINEIYKQNLQVKM